MSTAKIRALIETHEAMGLDGTDALAEVEAIERAAETLKAVPVSLNTPALMEKADAYDLMERIAAQRSGS